MEVNGSLTSLLILTNDGEEVADGFETEFDEVVVRSLADANVMAGGDDPAAQALIDGVDIREYDALYIDPQPQTTIYAKVFLEVAQDLRIPCNLDPTTLAIIAKKFYLFKVLRERDVSIPSTVTVSTEKGLSDIEADLAFPVVAEKFEGFEKIDTEKLDDPDGLKSFAEHSEHGNHLIMAHDFVEGEVYDTLYIDGELISLKLGGEEWRKSLDDGASKNFHNLSSEKQELVHDAVDAIGARLCRVRIVDDQIVKVSASPRLDVFQDISGKDVYGLVADMLQEDETTEVTDA